MILELRGVWYRDELVNIELVRNNESNCIYLVEETDTAVRLGDMGCGVG